MAVSPSFILRCTLNHHSKPISVLSIRPDGQVLLSAGDDALIALWNLETGELLQEISCPYNGFVTAGCWLPAVRGIAKAFAVGCADGSIHIYVLNQEEHYHQVSFNRSHDGPIEDIAFECTRRRLASVARGSVQVWTINDDYSIMQSHSPVSKRPYIARSVQFCDSGEVVLVFYLESHEIVAYDLEPFRQKWVTEIPTRTGYATFAQDQMTLLISNLVNGIDSYSITGVSPGLSPKLIQSFRHSVRVNVPLQVTSAMQGNWVISGGDDGSVRIFDQRNGELLKCLRHGEVDTLVQVVASHSEGEKCVIVSGTSGPGPSTIKVWSHKPIQQGIAPDAAATSGYSRSTWQVCVIVTVVSVAVHLALPHMPLLVKSLCAWLLQMLVAWGANGMLVDTVTQYGDTNVTYSG